MRRLVSLLVVCLLTPSVFVQDPAQAIAPDNITVQGRGWGWTGLQQWGALGYAIDHFGPTNRFFSTTTQTRLAVMSAIEKSKST